MTDFLLYALLAGLGVAWWRGLWAVLWSGGAWPILAIPLAPSALLGCCSGRVVGS